MLLLTLLAFLAGAGTALSACVLPVLPAVLSAGVTGGRGRPLGVATGLVVSFTFATVALVYLLDALDLPDDFARDLAIAVLIGFGLVMLVPPVAARLEAAISRLAPSPARTSGDGFGSGLVLGFSLGFVYAPCAGPILAGVITASAAQAFTLDKLLVALAYGTGTGVVIYAILLGGRRLARRLAPLTAHINYVMGVLMIAAGVLLFANLDIKFNAYLARHAPTPLFNPTRSIETVSAIEDDLADVRGGEGSSEGGAAEAEAGSPLPVLGRAPDFIDNQRWFNTPRDRPLSLDGLRGKVVLVDFWTYTCINCLRELPHTQALYEHYRREGLVVVGVHTPEFPFERIASNVEQAISDIGISFPVAQDNEYGTWNAYGNRYWPAIYLIDARGRVRYAHFGEGAYETTERAVRSLLAEAGRGRLGSGDAEERVRAEVASRGVSTPESYLGALRADRFVSAPILPGVRTYAPPRFPLPPDHLAYAGTWRITGAGATARQGAELKLNFEARRVFLVLGSAAGPRELQVLLDGRPLPDSLAGEDVRGAVAVVHEQRLYRLVDLGRVERHTLTLRFAPGISGYAFTFG